MQVSSSRRHQEDATASEKSESKRKDVQAKLEKRKMVEAAKRDAGAAAQAKLVGALPRESKLVGHRARVEPKIFETC